MNLPLIRKTSVVLLSFLIVTSTVLFGEDLLNMIITPLPQSLKSCISKNFSNEVNAQATCSSIANGNSVAVWESVAGSPTGKLRESKIYEDYTNGELGINTANPVGALHMSGNTTNLAVVFTNTANTVGSKGYRIGFDNNRLNFQGADDTGNFQSNQMVITKSTGNVGIGTSTPIAKLDILAGAARTGTYSTSPGFYVTSTMQSGLLGPGTGNVEFLHDNGTQGIGFGFQTIYQAGQGASTTNLPLNLLSKGTGNITLNAYPYSTGNVGIGIVPATSPLGYKLDVGGTIRATGRINANEYIQFNDSSSGLYTPLAGVTNGYFEPNSLGLHGAWQISGSKNSWNALNFIAPSGNGLNGGNLALMMNLNTQVWGNQVTGVYNQAQGVWLWRFDHQALTASRMTDANNTAYYADPNGTSLLYDVRAEVFYDKLDTTYYMQPRATSKFNAVRANTQYITPYGFIYGDGRLHIQAQGGEILYLNPYATGGQVLVGSSGGNTAGLYVYGTVGQSSDARFKKDIRPIENALDKVLALKGEYFTYKKTDKKSIGFIAQDVKPILPEVVQTDKDGYLGLDYANLTAVLNEAIKEFHAQFTAFKKDISEKVAALTQKQDAQAALIEKQQKQIDDLQKKVEALEKK